MNKRLVFHIVGRLLLAEAALLLPSAVMSLFYHDGDTLAFLITIAATLLCGLPLELFLKPPRNNLSGKDGIAVAGLCWIVFSVFGALPGVISGAIPAFHDAFFEMVSGFTTTGATVLSDVEALPHGVQFWRCFTHWIGGMGVLVLTVAVLPKLSGRTNHMARAESPGPTFSKLLPRMSDSAKILYFMYIVLTLVEFVCLLAAGMPPYPAILHTFSTAGTGGFSCYNAGISYFNSPLIEWIIAVFMLLFGLNFATYFHLCRRNFSVLKSEELWTYLGITLFATVFITLNIQPANRDFFLSLRQAFFTVTSISSTTGFGTADFDLWPAFSKGIIVLLLCFGACAGSTAGGFKISRVVILFKTAYRSLLTALQPRKVRTLRFEGKPVAEETVSSILVYLFLYVVLILVGGLLLTLTGVDLGTALTSSLTCVNNVGPGFNLVGPTQNFAFYPPAAKYLLSFLMLAGRLEIYPILLLFTRGLWRKYG